MLRQNFFKSEESGGEKKSNGLQVTEQDWYQIKIRKLKDDLLERKK